MKRILLLSPIVALSVSCTTLDQSFRLGAATGALTGAAATYAGSSASGRNPSIEEVGLGDHSATKGLVAKNSGFSLHAGVATKAHERDKFEKICRYIARPAVSDGRFHLAEPGNFSNRSHRSVSDVLFS
jgi:hypothetical protein